MTNAWRRADRFPIWFERLGSVFGHGGKLATLTKGQALAPGGERFDRHLGMSRVHADRMMSSSLRLHSLGAAPLLLAALACSDGAGEPAAETGGASNAGTGGSGAAPGGSGGGGGNTPGTGGSSATGGSPATGGTSGAGGTGAAASGGAAGSGGTTGPATCSEAAGAYVVSGAMLNNAPAVATTANGWGSEWFARVPVAADATSSRTYVGFTSADGGSVIAEPSGVVAVIPDAVMGGVAVTEEGVAALVFDPNTNVDDRRWAAVHRFTDEGSVLSETDLFRSPNLDDVGTKGAPGTSRLGYVSEIDEVVAYFGHTERYDDGVRHQGGYLARVNAEGEQTILSDWFGSHNLDQRLLTLGTTAAVIGLGDAYPEGIFFSFLGERPRAGVLYPLASAGNGSTNGQLGGMVDLGDEILIPFITNNTVPQDLDAGTWPDIDEEISQRIRDAAGNGRDLGLLRLPASGEIPDGGLTATWIDTGLAEGSRLLHLKSARYGTGDLVLLIWAEATGSGRQSQISGYYSMVIDGTGAVCQPKTLIDSAFAVTGGDDIVRRSDGSIVWANVQNGAAQLVTLTPN